MGSRKAGVGVGRADHPELEWVRADVLLILQAAFERLAGVLARQHVLGVGGRPEAAFVPRLEIGELIARREHRVRLAVALHLCDFVDRLPSHAALRVVAVERLLRGQRDIVKHHAAREIAVVRDRQQTAAGLLLVGSHPLPQFLGVLRVILRDRDDLIRLGLAVAKNDVAVEIVSVGRGRPLEANERRELSGLVVFLGGGGDALPHGPGDGIVILQRILPLEHDFAPRVIRLPALTTLYQIMDPPSELRLEQIRIGLGDHRSQAEILGVIGDNQEIQRALQTCADARARSDLFARANR